LSRIGHRMIALRSRTSSVTKCVKVKDSESVPHNLSFVQLQQQLLPRMIVHTSRMHACRWDERCETLSQQMTNIR
jgi:hypothetical protein